MEVTEVDGGKWVALREIDVLTLISAWSALRMNVKYGGDFYGRGSTTNAADFVSRITGESYPKSKKGRKRALDDCFHILHTIEEAEGREDPSFPVGKCPLCHGEED